MAELRSGVLHHSPGPAMHPLDPMLATGTPNADGREHMRGLPRDRNPQKGKAMTSSRPVTCVADLTASLTLKSLSTAQAPMAVRIPAAPRHGLFERVA